VAFKNAIASQYLIDDEAGRGGMAVVYVARDVRLGRRVAVKVLAPEVESPATAAAFRREIDYTLRLEHPNILPLLDVGEAAGLTYYVMRYVRGGSLRKRLEQQRRLSLPEAARIVRQTATALEYAHRQRILHCDVKPENILLEGDHVYLADFGMSRPARLDSLDWTLRVAPAGGTASYVSPEQALGERMIDPRADLYSLACVAYEMLAGRAPFVGSTDQEIVARRFTNPVVASDALPPTVPKATRAEIVRALSLEPGDRQTSVTAFAAAFRSRARPRFSSIAQAMLATLYPALLNREAP
jgi:serine/threonine protein kinase